MRKLRRSVAVLVLAGVLASLAVTTVPVLADGGSSGAGLSFFCGKLHSAIDYLSGLQQTRFVTFLLNAAKKACVQHCDCAP